MQDTHQKKAAVVYDRYPLFLEAVESLLRSIGLDVVGVATMPEDAVELVRELRPDLFIAGLSTPSGSIDALDLVDAALELHPDLKVIALADEDDEHDVDTIFAAGVCAFLSRAALANDVAFAVRQSYEPSIHLALDRDERRRVERHAEDGLLTGREQEILVLVAQGHTNGDLARILHVAPQTVKYHLSNIYRKLDVANRTQATRQAQLLNLLPRPTRRTASPARS
jgi:two-component system, NarL family, response regulator LiaR